MALLTARIAPKVRNGSFAHWVNSASRLAGSGGTFCGKVSMRDRSGVHNSTCTPLESCCPTNCPSTLRALALEEGEGARRKERTAGSLAIVNVRFRVRG